MKIIIDILYHGKRIDSYQFEVKTIKQEAPVIKIEIAPTLKPEKRA